MAIFLVETRGWGNISGYKTSGGAVERHVSVATSCAFRSDSGPRGANRWGSTVICHWIWDKDAYFTFRRLLPGAAALPGPAPPRNPPRVASAVKIGTVRVSSPGINYARYCAFDADGGYLPRLRGGKSNTFAIGISGMMYAIGSREMAP